MLMHFMELFGAKVHVCNYFLYVPFRDISFEDNEASNFEKKEKFKLSENVGKMLKFSCLQRHLDKDETSNWLYFHIRQVSTKAFPKYSFKKNKETAYLLILHLLHPCVISQCAAQ